jgi:AbrB family looped-hinge helix DNA binding protein
MNTTAHTHQVWFTTKGQVVIPAWLRRAFHIQNGTRAVVQATEQGILLKPVTPQFIHGLRGSLKGKGVMKAMMEDRAREREL